MRTWLDRLRNALGIGSKPASNRVGDEDNVPIPNVSDLVGGPSSAKDFITGEQILRQIRDAMTLPVAFQALWDGDTEGWRVHIEMVYREGAGYEKKCLAALRFGGDIRVFNGQVPPWPEATVAAQLGDALARRFGVPFFFPSPREPDDDCPNWWEQDQAIACADCGKLIMPPDSAHLPKDICHRCHRERERKQEIRMDLPESPNGVRILVGKGDDYKQVCSTTDAKTLALVGLIFETPGRESEAHDKGQIVFEGDDLGPLAAQIDMRIKSLLDNFRPDPQIVEAFQRTAIKIEYDGQTLELNMYDNPAQEIMFLIYQVKAVRQAQKDQLRFWLVFRRGMTKRMDHLLRLVAQRTSPANIQQMVDACQGLLDEVEVRKALQQLEDLGHVRCSGVEIRMTASGRAVL